MKTRKNRVVPLRIPQNVDDLAALSAQERHTDKAATLRQWIHEGAAHYVLELVSEGRISVGRAAELLDATPYDLYHLAKTHGMELGASDEQRARSQALAETISRPGR